MDYTSRARKKPTQYYSDEQHEYPEILSNNSTSWIFSRHFLSLVYYFTAHSVSNCIHQNCKYCFTYLSLFFYINYLSFNTPYPFPFPYIWPSWSLFQRLDSMITTFYFCSINFIFGIYSFVYDGLSQCHNTWCKKWCTYIYIFIYYLFIYYTFDTYLSV